MSLRPHRCAAAAAVALYLCLAASFSFAAGQEPLPQTSAQTTPAPAPLPSEPPARAKQRALFEAHRQLEEKVAAALRESADDARAFGKFLTAGERRRLQAGCTSLSRNPENTEARELLRESIQRHPEQAPRVVARYCFDPSLRLLQQEVRATRRALQERSASNGEEEGPFDFRLRQLERKVEGEKQRYAAIRGIMLAGEPIATESR